MLRRLRRRSSSCGGAASIYATILLPLIVLLALHGHKSLASSFSVPQPPTCATPTSHVFDIAALQCLDCGSALTPPHVATVDGRSCRCSAGYRNTYATANQDEFTCMSCVATSKAASRDGIKCMGCDAASGATFNASANTECQCPVENGPGYVLVETTTTGVALVDKQCVHCPTYGRVFPAVDPYTCVLCPDVNQVMSASSVCMCAAGYQLVGTVCVTTADASANAAARVEAPKITYHSVQSSDGGGTSAVTITSSVYDNAFLPALVRCKDQRVRTACQALGNMCTFVKYDTTHAACKSFASVQASVAATSHGGAFPGWKDGLPWLEYADTAVLSSEALQSKLSLFNQADDDVARARVSHMKYVLAKYAFNGTYLGTEVLTDQLQLCGGDPRHNVAYQRFATNFENKCKFSLQSLLTRTGEPCLYDLYVVDTNSQLFPLPVKVVNYRKDGVQVNADGGGGGDGITLHRRFFLYDTLTSRTATGSIDVLVYARTIHIDVRMRSNELIYPPLVTIEYAERKVSAISATKFDAASTSRVSFSVTYTRSLSAFWTWASVLFSFGLVWIVLSWIRQYYVWQRVNEIQQVDCSFLVRALIWLFGALANTFFWLAFVLSAYAWIFYKGQQTASFLLPATNGTEVVALNTVIVFAFVGKLLDVGYIVWRQIHADLFFVDWEEPKDTADHGLQTLGGSGGGSGDQLPPSSPPPPHHHHRNQNVSAWRRLFVTNEWNELQSVRLVNVGLMLFTLLFFLRGVNLEYMATAQPVMSNLSPDAAPMHPILRFAVNTFFLFTMAMCQLVFRHLLYHRYVEDRAAQFVDLLSFTNISLFVFDVRYRMSYVHGKTVHPHADVSLAEINRQIASEQRNWTKPRGLVNGKDVFDVYVSRQFRAHYDRLYVSTLSRELRKRQADSRRQQQQPHHQQHDQQQQQQQQQRRHQRPTPGTNDAEHALFVNEELLEANMSLNDFLIAFIQRDNSKFPWKVRSPTPWMKLLALPPAFIEDPTVSMFYEDDDSSFGFTRNLLMGVEYDLVLFLILLYAVSDIIFSNTFANILVVYVVNRAIMAVRSHWGQKNVSLKTLCDSRFLV